MLFNERKRASEGNFYELTRAIRMAAGSRLDGIDITHIQFYHDLRNKLYHQGNGITIPVENAKGYAQVAVNCLDRLLGIDLRPELARQGQSRRTSEENAILEQIRQAQDRIRIQIGQIDQELRLALENVESALVMPSFELQFKQWQKRAGAKAFVWSSKRMLDSTLREDTSETEIVEFPQDEVERFVSELRQSMPLVLSQVISKYQVTADVVVNFAYTENFTELLLILADIALGLSTDPSDRILAEVVLLAKVDVEDEDTILHLVNNQERQMDELLERFTTAESDLISLRNALPSRKS